MTDVLTNIDDADRFWVESDAAPILDEVLDLQPVEDEDDEYPYEVAS